MKTKSIHATFPVLGMSCAGCAARVEKTLRAQEGVSAAAVNLAAATATVDYDPARCSAERLRSAVEAVGYDLIITPDEEQAARDADAAAAAAYRALRRRTLWAIGLALPLIVLGMGFMGVPGVSYALFILSTPLVFGLGSVFFVNAFRQLRHRSANMDTLVALSTGIAYAYSLFVLFFPGFWRSHGLMPHVYFEAAGGVVAFVLVGRLLEARAKRGTSTALRGLMARQPRLVVRLGANGRQEEADVRTVRCGDTLLVRPGERVAVDGTVVSGASYVDESLLSGEPVPVAKQCGDRLFAGTINGSGSLSYRADKVGADTVLAQIVRMVREAQGSKAPVQRLVDRVAAVFVPVIMGIALLAFVGWFALAPADGLTHGLHAAVTVLVIACPCALGLATPTALMVGIGKGAEAGILVKDAESLETARRVDTVVFDKTGTLTQGRPAVTGIDWLADSDRMLAAAFAALERRSDHPLAHALADAMPVASVDVTDFKERAGRGVCGTVGGHRLLAGNARLMAEAGIGVEGVDAGNFGGAAPTLIYLAADGRLCALAAISDTLRPTATAAVAGLRQRGCDVCLLTGDNGQAAAAVARAVGITRYQADVLPADKAAYIRRLREAGHCVAMVGDGINDSAAMAEADLAIAMGRGSDVAMDVAGMTIIASDPAKVPTALRLSALTVGTIRQNLFWAFVYNVLAVPVAAGVLYPVCGLMLDPMVAGAAMAMSSVSVVLNSLRLKRKHL